MTVMEEPDEREWRPDLANFASSLAAILSHLDDRDPDRAPRAVEYVEAATFTWAPLLDVLHRKGHGVSRVLEACLKAALSDTDLMATAADGEQLLTETVHVQGADLGQFQPGTGPHNIAVAAAPLQAGEIRQATARCRRQEQ